MTRKLTVLGLAAILAIVFAVPALGQTSTVTPTVSQSLSLRALAKARLALLTARSAKSQSRVAVRTAGAAVNTANEAKTAASDAKSAVAAAQSAARVQSGFAVGTVSTESENFVQLAGGPSVTVNVPPSGLIEVWAQVTFEEDGGVGLFEDGQLVPGQTPHCGPGEEGRGLLASFAPPGPEAFTLATPGSDLFGYFCGTESPPAAVLFQTSPGPHTYELRYASCGCTPEAVFSKRRLFVAPRL